MLTELLEYWRETPIPWKEVKYTEATKGLLSVVAVLEYILSTLPESEQEKQKEQFDKLADFVVSTVPRHLQ